MRNRVTPVPLESKRVCAVTVDVGDSKTLLVCVYMPCDDRRQDHNTAEYKDMLNDIEILCNSVDVDTICIGGDFNTELARDSAHTIALNNFALNNDLFYCARHTCCSIKHTYCSKINGGTTFIDHFLLSNNL